MLRDLRKTYFYYESESFGGLLRRFFLFLNLYIKIISFKPNYRDKAYLNSEKALWIKFSCMKRELNRTYLKVPPQ